MMQPKAQFNFSPDAWAKGHLRAAHTCPLMSAIPDCLIPAESRPLQYDSADIWLLAHVVS